jgi:hypothetical protein
MLGRGWDRSLVERLLGCFDGKIAEDLEAALISFLDGEVLPLVDLVEGSVGPGLDGVEETDEEVDGEGPDVGLILEGVVLNQPGLYFVGLYFLHALWSETITGVQTDAQHVATHLLQHQLTAAPSH